MEIDPIEVVETLKDYKAAPSKRGYRAYAAASEPQRKERLRRLNEVRGGIQRFVSMRRDLLRMMREDSKLEPLDVDFQHLLRLGSIGGFWFCDGSTGQAQLKFLKRSSLMRRSTPSKAGTICASGCSPPTGTVGFPLPGVELKSTDSQTGATLPQGDIGEIEVRGPNVFKGYWQMLEKAAEELRSDGVFITGDLGQIDADGYVSIVGFNKDLIISRGYYIYPKEIELLLGDQEGVLESAVDTMGKVQKKALREQYRIIFR